MFKTALFLLLAGCAVDELSTDTQDLIGGFPTAARPEVVQFVSETGEGCTATLLSPSTFLTAAHCIGFASQSIGDSLIVNGTQLGVTRTFSQGGEHGADDLAVGRLTFPVNIATPATIATSEPTTNQWLTVIGFGCTTSNTDRDCVGHTAREYITYWYNGSPTYWYAHGDSGGPTFLGALNDPGQTQIVRVTSTQTYLTGADIGADAVAYRAQILALDTTLRNTGVSYRSHVQSLGWTSAVQNGAVSGTTQNLRLEGLQVWTQNPGESVCYSAWVNNQWQAQACDGALSGTVGQSLPIRAIKIDRHVGTRQLPLHYRTYSALGWSPWVENGIESGTEINNIEAIQIEFQTQVVIPPGCCNGIN